MIFTTISGGMKRHSIAYLLANRSTIPLSLYTTINKNSCRYCANSSSLKSTTEEAISDSDKGAKSSDEKLKGKVKIFLSAFFFETV